jgi:hypothetical protein
MMLNRLQDVFSSLHDRNVKYLVIGGIATVLHGVPRATFDLDILIEPTVENAQRLLDAFLDANLGTADITTAENILAHEITVFRDRVRIVVQTMTPGNEFARAWKDREIMQYGGQDIFVLSRTHLIASKFAAGRDIDLEDARLLSLDDEGLELRPFQFQIALFSQFA